MRPLAYLPGSLRSLQVQIEKALSVFFDQYTVGEWIEQHITPMIKTMEDLNNRAQILTSITSWPQRPLDFKKEDKKRDESEPNKLKEMRSKSNQI